MNRSVKQKRKRDNTAKRRGWPMLSSLKQSTASDSVNQETKAFPDSEPLILCGSVRDLWLSDFITCSVDKDYKVLIQSGTPTPEQLLDCWFNIVSQYYVLIKSKEAKKYVELEAKIKRFKIKIMNVECLIYALQSAYHEELADCLRIWGYEYDFTPESIGKDITKIIAKLGNDKTRLAVAESEYDDYLEAKKQNADSTTTTTREYYDDMLMTISLHYKVNPFYRAETIKTSEFALMCNQYSAYVKQVNDKSHAQ